MEILETREGDALVLAVTGRADTVSSPIFEESVMANLEAGEIKLVLQLENLDYISSAGLRVILLTAKRIADLGGSLTLCGLQETVEKVLEVSGFLSLLRVADTLEDALQN